MMALSRLSITRTAAEDVVSGLNLEDGAVVWTNGDGEEAIANGVMWTDVGEEVVVEVVSTQVSVAAVEVVVVVMLRSRGSTIVAGAAAAPDHYAF